MKGLFIFVPRCMKLLYLYGTAYDDVSTDVADREVHLKTSEEATEVLFEVRHFVYEVGEFSFLDFDCTLEVFEHSSLIYVEFFAVVGQEGDLDVFALFIEGNRFQITRAIRYVDVDDVKRRQIDEVIK